MRKIFFKTRELTKTTKIFKKKLPKEIKITTEIRILINKKKL